MAETAIATVDGNGIGDKLIAKSDGIEVHEADEGFLGTIETEDFIEFAEDLDAVVNGDAESMDAPTWDEIGAGQGSLGSIAFYETEYDNVGYSDHPYAMFDPWKVVELADEL